MRVFVTTAVALTSLGVFLVGGGCGSFTGTDGTPTRDDGSQGDGDGAVGVSSDDGGSGPAQYAALNDKTRWEVVDLGTFVNNANGYRGGTFDGRYVYLAPYSGTNFLRYDTQGSFSSSGSWQTSNLGMAGLQYLGMGFDGRFVYAAPFEDGQNAGLRALLRYDTKLDWKAPASWDTYTLSAGRFAGVGRGPGHMFFSPRGGVDIAVVSVGQSPDGGVTLVDAGSPPAEYRGGAFAAGHYYLAPYAAPGGATASGAVLRYEESTGAFNPASATTFDYSKAMTDTTARGFGGAVTDGRYVYFVPYFTDADGFLSTVLRYDTTLPFDKAGSYQTFDIQQKLAQPKARGFVGSTFDGRFVYFVPEMDDTDTNTFIVRFDTTASNFTAAASWQIYDLHGVDVNAGGYWGAVFDGEYVYLSPNSNNVMLRFHARTPRALPAPFPAAP